MTIRTRLASLRSMPSIISLLSVLFLLSGSAKAAQKPPVQWHVKASPGKPVKAGARFNVTISGQLDPGWHLYALEEPKGGPIATEVALTDGDPADLLRVEEGKPKFLPDPVTQQPAGYFEGAAEFTLHLQSAKDASAGPEACGFWCGTSPATTASASHHAPTPSLFQLRWRIKPIFVCSALALSLPLRDNEAVSRSRSSKFKSAKVSHA